MFLGSQFSFREKVCNSFIRDGARGLFDHFLQCRGTGQWASQLPEGTKLSIAFGLVVELCLDVIEVSVSPLCLTIS